MYNPVSLSIENLFSYKRELYTFRQGKPSIIIGENNDNPSQRRNGSGKSGFVECVALAYIGSPTRDVRSKEIVRRGCKSGEVQHILFNTYLNKYLIIWRRFHSGSKPSECRVWISSDGEKNDSEELRLSDINEYNKMILELLDLTKEDLFNFYILTDRYYNAFLKVNDNKKKEIVNRFSGADNINQVFDLINQDLSEIDSSQIEKQIEGHTTKQFVYQEQIDQLEIKQSNIKQEKTTKKEEIQSNINEKQSEIKQYENQIFSKQKEIFELEQKLKAHTKTVDLDQLNIDLTTKKQQRNKLNDDLPILQQSLTSIDTNKEYVEFRKQINTVEKQYIEQNNIDNKTLDQLNNELQELEQFKNSIENQLEATIECPKCTHKFNLRNKQFNYEEAKEQLPEVKQLIIDQKAVIDKTQQLNKKSKNDRTVEIDKLNQDLKAAIDSDKDDINKQIANHHQLISSIDKQINQLEITQQSFESTKKAIGNDIVASNKSIVSLNNLILELNKVIEQYDNQLLQINKLSYQDDINQLNDQIIESIRQQNELLIEYQKIKNKHFDLSQWIENFKGFKSFIANQSIHNIQDVTNIFLDKMGSDLSIELSGYKTLANKTLKEQISVEICRNNIIEGSYGSYSGGERGRVDICVIFAIQELINLNCKTGGLNLIICDEILDSVEPYGLEKIIQSAKNIDKTVLIVSQNEINALAQDTIRVVKTNNISVLQ